MQKMISSQLTSILSNLGWGSGFRLPVANDENRALENLLEQKQKRLLEIHASLEVDTQHCKILQSHLERTSGALKETQKMTHAKRNGLETEQNLKELADRMHSRYKSDLQAAKQEVYGYNDRNQRLSEEVESRRRVIEDLIATVKFDQVAVQRFKQVTEDKENYISFIQTMTFVDERVAQDFQLKFQKTGEELHDSRAKLNDAATNTLSLQQQFNRLCQQFRRVHDERRQAIQLWEGTLKSMQQRDENIKDVAEEYAAYRSKVQYLEEMCDRHQKMLQQEENNTGEIDYELNLSDKACSIMKSQLAQFKEAQAGLADDIMSYNSLTNNSNTALKQMQNQLTSLDKEMVSIQNEMQKLELDIVDAKLRHGMAMTEATTEENRTKEIEDSIDKEEQRAEKTVREIERFRRLLWARSNECTQLENEIKTGSNRVKGLRSLIASLKEQAKIDEFQVQKDTQQAYQLELEVIAMESKILQMTSNSEASSSSISKEYVFDMRNKLQEVMKTRTFLQAQEAHLANMNKRLQWEFDTVVREYRQLQAVVDSLKMEAKRCVMENKKASDDVQSLQLETRLLQMALRRFHKQSLQEKDIIHSLEQDRLTMEAAVKERKSEIEIHMSLLRNQQKILKEELSKLTSYIVEVTREINLYKTRYEYTLNALGSDGGEDHTESYYILKHTQEREALRREGDMWDAKVKEAEKEIAALENTLSVLVSSNVAFKDSLSPAAAETPEAQILETLEEEQKLTLVRKRKAEKHLAELSKQCNLRDAELSEAQNTKSFLEGLLGEKKYEMSNIHFEIASQKEKIIRANRMANRLIKELGLHMHEDREMIELDLKLRCAREKFEYGLKTLEKTLFVHCDMRERSLKFMEESLELQPVLGRLKRRLEMPDADASFHFRHASGRRQGTPTTLSLAPSKHHIEEETASRRSSASSGPQRRITQGRATTASAGRQRSIGGITAVTHERAQSSIEGSRRLPRQSLSLDSVQKRSDEQKLLETQYLKKTKYVPCPPEHEEQKKDLELEVDPEEGLSDHGEAEVHSISEDEAQLASADTVSQALTEQAAVARARFPKTKPCDHGCECKKCSVKK